MMTEAATLPSENLKPIAIRKRRAPAPSAQRDMQMEMAAASALKEQLVALFGEDDDSELLRDTIEGQTDLLEMVDRVLEQMTRDREMIAGIEEMAAKREMRKKRLKDRCGAVETMLLGVLEILGERRIERPLALIYTRKNPDKAVITDEALIPAAYFTQPEPSLSKPDLLRALKDHRDTLDSKLFEIADRVKSGEMSDADANQARERIIVAFPPIPGAELEPGGTGITVKWS